MRRLVYSVLGLALGGAFPAPAAADHEAPRPPAQTARKPRAEAPRRADAAGRPASATSLASYDYVATAIPPLAGKTRSRGYGINNQGQVAARASNYSDAEQKDIERQAFAWDPVHGGLPLRTLSGESGVWGINDAGLVSGYAYNASGFQHAVRWDTALRPVPLTDLGTLTNTTTSASGNTSTAYDLNAGGQVTGYSEIPNDAGNFTPFHAILYDDASGLRDLGTFDTTFPEWQHGYSISYDANTLGRVVGVASSTEGGPWHFRPFVYDAASGLQELQRDPAYADPSREWYAVAINDSELIGGHVIAAAGQSLPYYWPDAASAPSALGMPPEFPYGEIYGVNATGRMVGIMWNDAGVEHAFVFDTALGVRDLNALADPAAGWTFEFARDINDAGQIVGSGTWNGLKRGFVLTPVGLMGQISGDVRHNLTGAGLEGVTVRLYGAAGALMSQTVTDAQGRYTSTLVPAGTYFAVTGNALGYPEQLYKGLPCAPCDPTTGTPVVVGAGSLVSGIEFELGPQRYTLTVNTPTHGRITAIGITCGSGAVDCTETYDYGTVVTFAAAPDTGYRLRAWTGACSGTGPCSVTVDANKSVGGLFALTLPQRKGGPSPHTGPKLVLNPTLAMEGRR
jgi:probable HAF family extracellular repeat protein